MHFSWVCAVEEPTLVHSLMWPYWEEEYEYDENPPVIPFRDRYEIWGRRAWIIKLKEWCKGYDDTPWLWYWTWSFDKEVKKWYCSVAQKRDIEHFYKWEKDSDAYPHARMYFDKDGDPHFQPEDVYRDAEEHTLKTKPEAKKEKKKFLDDLEDWYERVPDNYYIVIIDYHD